MNTTIVQDIELEKKEILKQYRHLLRVIKPRLEKGDKRQIRMAFDMALEAHKDTRRKSGEPVWLRVVAAEADCARTTEVIRASLSVTLESMIGERLLGRTVALGTGAVAAEEGAFFGVDERIEAAFAQAFGQKVATGLYHDYSGYIFFPVAIGLMIGIGALLNCDLRATWLQWKTHYLHPQPAGNRPSHEDKKLI